MTAQLISLIFIGIAGAVLAVHGLGATSRTTCVCKQADAPTSLRPSQRD